jgi:hypothetical protein
MTKHRFRFCVFALALGGFAATVTASEVAPGRGGRHINNTSNGVLEIFVDDSETWPDPDYTEAAYGDEQASRRRMWLHSLAARARRQAVQRESRPPR